MNTPFDEYVYAELNQKVKERIVEGNLLKSQTVL